MRFTVFVCSLTMVVCLLAASGAGAETIPVSPGGDLQAAINAAKPGDVITLAPNATYVGNFVLTNKGALADYITIRSAASDASLPSEGTRMTPEYAAFLPKIKSPNNMSALTTAAAANHWKLMFLEFQANVNGYGDIVSLGAGDKTQTQLSQVPYALVLDRLYIHGDPVLGQKRGIALHSRDTEVRNSWISDCKVVGQEAQAISGFNGPGNYVIENNYLEGATQNFLLGGSDPTIPNLVTSNITFRYNHLTKPLAWRDAIIATPAGVTAVALSGAGSLPAATYSYKVQARVPAGQTNKANSASSVEVAATIAVGTTGAVTISWKPVPGAQDYLVYGRTAGAQNMNWTTTTPYFVDNGAAGAAGSPAGATKWLVKNVFELKNAQHLLIEGNVFENNWIAGQTGYAIVFTPRNQGGTAPWAVVQDVTFRHNTVRHTAGGVNILGTDDLKPSQRTNTITVTDNVFDDLTSATWGSGSRVFQVGDGPDRVKISHNTVFTTDSTILVFDGTQATNFEFTNNVEPHNTYGINGTGSTSGLPSITKYAPGSNVCANVFAGGNAKLYPPCNYFPTKAEWLAGFKDYAGGDYHLLPGFVAKYPSTDGPDLGADITTTDAMAAIALSGRSVSRLGCNIISLSKGGQTLPVGVLGKFYAEAVTCTGGGPGPYAWRLDDATLPDGLTFDPSAAIVSGTPTIDAARTLTIVASDPANPNRFVTETLSLTIDLPDLEVQVPATAASQVGQQFELKPTVTGAIGTTTWSASALPAGLTQDPATGVISGVPSAWGQAIVTVGVRDSRGRTNLLPAPVTIMIAPAPLVIEPIALPDGRSNTMYSVSLNTTGGAGGVTWSLDPERGTLPTGVIFDSGTISGVPTSVGTFTFVVKATDALQAVATATLSLTIERRDIVVYAADATVVSGAWSVVADATAAGGSRLANPDAAAAKLAAALASPVNYFELTFNAEAGVAYHLWMRGKAEKNSWANDSVYVQFSGSVDANLAAINRIGSTKAMVVSIEEGTNAGLSGWGWGDDSYGGFGNPIYFATTGPQTIRVQVREDGISLDQIVLGADTYATVAPGTTKNDTTIVPR